MNITKQETELLSAVAIDLLTGNHLLGRKRSQEQIKIHNEFCEACEAVVREQKLTERQKTLIVAMGKNFYGGLTDMAEQLCISTDKLKKALPDEPSCEVYRRLALR